MNKSEVGVDTHKMSENVGRLTNLTVYVINITSLSCSHEHNDDIIAVSHVRLCVLHVVNKWTINCNSHVVRNANIQTTVATVETIFRNVAHYIDASNVYTYVINYNVVGTIIKVNLVWNDLTVIFKKVSFFFSTFRNTCTLNK